MHGGDAGLEPGEGSAPSQGEGRVSCEGRCPNKIQERLFSGCHKDCRLSEDGSTGR